MKHQVVSYDHWLCLAAAPSFAIMALLTSVLGSGQPDMLCSAAHDASSRGGLVAMYLLMSAFHFPPWLKLISGRRSGAYSSCVIIGLSPHPESLTQKAIQPQIVIEQLNGLRSQRQKADFIAFATHADLRLRRQDVVAIQR